MELFLVRHGIAESREEFQKKGLDDHLRPLTPKGRQKIEKIGTFFLEKVGCQNSIIVTSPYKRAQQTAEIFEKIFGPIEVIEAPELVPHCSPVAFLKWIKAHGKNCEQMIVVGHEPHLSHLASFVLAGKQESFIELKKGAILCLDVQSFSEIIPGSGILKWSVPPKMMC